MSGIKFNISIELLWPLLDLYISFLFRKVQGLKQIDLHAYAEQSKIYLTSNSSDYSQYVGDTGPIQYPAASLYIYSFFNIVTGYDINRWNMATVHMGLDMLRMWLLVKIYRKAFASRRNWA